MQNGSTALVCETERDRCGRKRTHTDTHSSHHHLHSRFLKSSHISVTIATLLCLPLFFIPAFFFPLKKNPSLPLSLSLVNITETPRLALHLLAQRGEGGRGTAHISEGVVKKPGWGQYQEVPDSQDGGLKRDRRPSSQKFGGLDGVS